MHYYNLATGTDAAIPNNGDNDSLSGISGTNVVYTHADMAGNFSINSYAIGSGNPPAAVDPETGSVRMSPAIGGDTVAWVDFTANPTTPQIIVYDTATQTTTTLAADDMANVQPAVSPDGNVVVWAKCDPSGTPCNIWEAIRSSGGHLDQRRADQRHRRQRASAYRREYRRLPVRPRGRPGHLLAASRRRHRTASSPSSAPTFPAIPTLAAA